METEIAAQNTYKIGEFELAGLAYDKGGSITLTSMMDLLVACLAASQNPQVEAVLRANNICVKDVNGKMFFPRIQPTGLTS